MAFPEYSVLDGLFCEKVSLEFEGFCLEFPPHGLPPSRAPSDSESQAGAGEQRQPARRAAGGGLEAGHGRGGRPRALAESH